MLFVEGPFKSHLKLKSNPPWKNKVRNIQLKILFLMDTVLCLESTLTKRQSVRNTGEPELSHST